jgi:chromosome segregation protein
MYLKRLELDGFKSFAKHAVLEFTTPISSVVGPNGSGKSNIAESVQWVLGEQSMKSLRGKKGEDLIFAGSSTTPRMSRASIKIVFDNSERRFKSVDFGEVAVERHVYRDGTNEYLLNGSKVRLKDVIEVLSDVGLGSSQHFIISQGEADRILYATPRERREMIEDALGIKIYQLKRKEAEKKLEATAENMRQVVALRREIQPHLKFLGAQAEKAKRSADIRIELREKLIQYLGREQAHLTYAHGVITNSRNEPAAHLKELEREIAELKKRLAEEDAGQGERRGAELKLTEARAKISDLRARYVVNERELGRVEGMIEAVRSMESREEYTAIPPQEMKKFLDELSGMLESADKEGSLEAVRAVLAHALTAVRAFGTRILKPSRKVEDVFELEGKREMLQKSLAELKAEEKVLHKDADELAERIGQSAQNLRAMERKIYEMEEKSSRVKDVLRALDLEGEKLRLRHEEYDRELHEAQGILDGAPLGEFAGEFQQAEHDDLRRITERLKIRLEEAGGVDTATLREYDEAKTRDEFLAKELADLESATTNLKQIITELAEKLDHDFKEGIKHINEQFSKFFESMFGGGKAEIRLVKPEKRTEAEIEESQEEYAPEEKEIGVEVFLDLPRKKIKSLDMLSGGERALTSIALLFAMSAVNPPPFLILDETDAALDEANSRRYASMLSSLSANTQLIVVTHNRETMRAAGSLFGVTMGRDGISRLLSVKLEEGEQYAK